MGLGLLFVLAASLFFFKGSNPEPEDEETLITQALKHRNDQEIKLQAIINTHIGDTLILTDSVFSQPVIISDTILIQRDSLYIKSGGNIIFRSDSAYAGPAFLLASTCKHITLDSMAFENFRVGISVQNSSLHVKNLRFINCATAVQGLFAFQQNQYVSGRLADGFFKTDTIPLLND